MTIVDDTLLIIRDEYPDLETEVKGILTARSQQGATISDIKEDYLATVGTAFPIYDRIAEFLLSIPSVSAVCNENGTLVFNIQPTSKTKHVHELIAQQKESNKAKSLKRLYKDRHPVQIRAVQPLKSLQNHPRKNCSSSWRCNWNYKTQKSLGSTFSYNTKALEKENSFMEQEYLLEGDQQLDMSMQMNMDRLCDSGTYPQRTNPYSDPPNSHVHYPCWTNDSHCTVDFVDGAIGKGGPHLMAPSRSDSRMPHYQTKFRSNDSQGTVPPFAGEKADGNEESAMEPPQKKLCKAPTRNWTYQDNVNYLQNRVLSQEFITPCHNLIDAESKAYMPTYKDYNHYNHYKDYNGYTNYNNHKELCFPNTEPYSQYSRALPLTTIQNPQRLSHIQSPSRSHIPKYKPKLVHQKHSNYGTMFHNNPNRRENSPRSLVRQSLKPPRRDSSVYKAVKTGLDYETLPSDYVAHYLDFLLMGDDFFLYMARMELQCKFRNDYGIYRSGLCISGQTIPQALELISRTMFPNPLKVIVNIGSVDIMQGSSFIQIQHDFNRLLQVMESKNLTPILTTLAPLINFIHDPEIKDKLERFNSFLKRLNHKYVVIDIYATMVSNNGNMLFGCYQNEPRNVTGAAEPYVFWNKIGRQRVLKLIESKL